MASDDHTTVSELRASVQAFVDEREWRPFHTPKNLSMSIAIEAAELMEHFQWEAGANASSNHPAAEDLALIREELADILCYALSFANALGIDVTDSLRDKLAKNERKYPAEEFRGRFK